MLNTYEKRLAKHCGVERYYAIQSSGFLLTDGMYCNADEDHEDTVYYATKQSLDTVMRREGIIRVRSSISMARGFGVENAVYVHIAKKPTKSQTTEIKRLEKDFECILVELHEQRKYESVERCKGQGKMGSVILDIDKFYRT